MKTQYITAITADVQQRHDQTEATARELHVRKTVHQEEPHSQLTDRHNQPTDRHNQLTDRHNRPTDRHRKAKITLRLTATVSHVQVLNTSDHNVNRTPRLRVPQQPRAQPRQLQREQPTQHQEAPAVSTRAHAVAA